MENEQKTVDGGVFNLSNYQGTPCLTAISICHVVELINSFFNVSDKYLCQNIFSVCSTASTK